MHRPVEERAVATGDGTLIAARMKRIAPRDIGAARIGHFGFFRSAYEASLWRAHLLPELA